MSELPSSLYLHGYEASEQPKADNIDDPQYWADTFHKAKLSLEIALRIHDPLCLLARTTSLCNVEGGLKKRGPETITLPALEVLQAMLLRQRETIARVPLSPNNFVRTWSTAESLLDAFIRMQPRDKEDALSEMANRSRMQTIHYRFNFDRDAALAVIKKITSRFDQKTQCSHQLEKRIFSLFALMDITVQRLHEFYDRVQEIYEATERSTVISGVEFLCEKSPLAYHTWQRVDLSAIDDGTLQFLAFQLSEISHEWIYTFAPDDLSELDRDTVSKLSAKQGDEADGEFEHLFMNNPVWAKPFIEKDDGSYFTAVPHIPLAFPFRIIGALLPEDGKTRKALSDARAEALEELIAEAVQAAMPLT
ncbi:hypothetical protein [Sulfitobacter donghicola]|nr:hypothetical protein [Sulfitobacter donghicola]